MYDLVIKNGLVYDGTGKAPFQADLGIEDTKIKRIGKINEPAKREINAN